MSPNPTVDMMTKVKYAASMRLRGSLNAAGSAADNKR
jgi:hypothetical protein